MLAAEALDGEVEELFPAAPSPAGPVFMLAGRVGDGGATLRLTFGRPGGPAQQRVVSIPAAAADDSAGASRPGLAARLWAQRKVESLSLDAGSRRKQLLRLGRRFGLVTPGASLLVLETLDQHLRHRIPPAATRTALAEEYRKLVRHWAGAVNDGRRWGPPAAPDAIQARDIRSARRRWRDTIDRLSAEPKPTTPGPFPAQVPDKTVPFRGRGMMASFGRSTAQFQAGIALSVDRSTDGQELDVDASPPSPTLSDRVAIQAGLAAGTGSGTRPDHDADRPLLSLRGAATFEDLHAAYLARRNAHAGSADFYFDAADAFLARGRCDLALRALGNLGEVRVDDAPSLRSLAYKLDAVGEPRRAAVVLERVLALRPEEPQSYRDLAMALAQCGPDGQRRAVRLLCDVILGDWDWRFEGVRDVALMDLNGLLARLRRADPAFEPDLPLDVGGRGPLEAVDADLCVVLSWDADMTDVDLWVTEPTGETCYAANRSTGAGGVYSNDARGGYGPEEYAIRRAPPGDYRLRAQFYEDRRKRLPGPVTLHITTWRNFGRPDERRAVSVHRLRPSGKPRRRPWRQRDGVLAATGCLPIVAAYVLFGIACASGIDGFAKTALALCGLAIACAATGALLDKFDRARDVRRRRRDTIEVGTVRV